MNESILCPVIESDADKNRIQNMKRGSRRSGTRSYRRFINIVQSPPSVWEQTLALPA